ncbi:MAG TPA: site-specific DNA-methyltransferase [Bacteroidia bacterium]|nr:site-specific DNA-methyltransferase [Bacteroidia bacterium]
MCLPTFAKPGLYEVPTYFAGCPIGTLNRKTKRKKAMENFLNKIINGNSLEVLKTIPDNSIDCCITSPPYWGLRDYGHEEQLGSEKHFKDFVINLSNVFDEVQRVLKPTGTCFINLGDTYAGSGSGTTKNADTSKYVENSKQVYVLPNGTSKASQFRGTAMNKSLCMIPERFAIEMIDRGWCLRNQIIWHKPNQMPSSAKDRFTVDFEKVFFFVKQPTDYYFEQQLEPYTSPMNRWGGDKLDANGESTWDGGTGQTTYRTRNMRPNEDGKNMRTVWSINTEPSTEAHFATYPQRLVERMLKAGCPENGIVLDPFFGSGTTGVYARKVNRNFVGIELNPEYVKIAENRLLKEIGMFL